MSRVHDVVARSQGKLQFVPMRELWSVSAVLADTFPLDRDLVRGPRWARRTSNWIRLLMVDKALTDRDRTAVLTLSPTPWGAAIVAAVLAALIAPALPRWLRVALFGGAVTWALRGRRASGIFTMRREIRRVAPDGLLVNDFVALAPGAGMSWVADALESVGHETPFVALLAASGDAHRDAALERLYVRRLGFERVGEAAPAGHAVTILVRG
jgi:hypothetical protein